MAKKKKAILQESRHRCTVSVNSGVPIVGGDPVDRPFLSNKLAHELFYTTTLPEHPTIRFSYEGVREQCCMFSWELDPGLMAMLARANARLEFCVDAREPLLDPAVTFTRVELGIWADPDEVTASLGLAPKTSYRVGQPRKPGSRALSDHSSWWFDITDETSHPPNLKAMCATLRNTLPEHTAELCRAHRSRVWIKFSIDGRRESPDGFGFVLEPQSVIQLASLGAPFVAWMLWV
jgi:hypothetical protein